MQTILAIVLCLILPLDIALAQKGEISVSVSTDESGPVISNRVIVIRDGVLVDQWIQEGETSEMKQIRQQVNYLRNTGREDSQEAKSLMKEYTEYLIMLRQEDLRAKETRDKH